MGIFDFLFESEEGKAKKIQQQEQARHERESLACTDWFKQQARIENVSIFKNTAVDFCYVPSGQFSMGDPPYPQTWYNKEKQVHVNLSAFFLARVPVTQKVWKAVTGESPSHFEGDPDLPVESVSWHDCYRFIRRLKKNPVIDGTKYRFDLPTEAQWEYACRAGSLGPYAVDQFWCTKQHPFPVGQLLGNSLCLQDMHGNVKEWCRDIGVDHCPGGDDPCVLHLPLPEPPTIRPRGWTPPALPPVRRILRGGFYLTQREFCRSAYREVANPDTRSNSTGFRLALVPSQ